MKRWLIRLLPVAAYVIIPVIFRLNVEYHHFLEWLLPNDELVAIAHLVTAFAAVTASVAIGIVEFNRWEKKQDEAKEALRKGQSPYYGAH